MNQSFVKPKSGANVLLIDNHASAGGELLARGVTTDIDGKAALDWVAGVVSELEHSSNVTLLFNTLVNGCHDHNFLTAVERRQDHLALKDRSTDARQRLHKIRASELVLATGAHERPLVFANNDVPGCFSAGAIVTYIKQFAVAPGERLVVCTNNDSGYEAAMAWNEASKQTNTEVVAVIDSRQHVSSDAHTAALNAGLSVMTGHVVVEAYGKKRVTGVAVSAVNADATDLVGELQELDCDTVATSGGFSPVVHLASHTGSRPVWDEQALGFVPGKTHEAQHFCGSLTGQHTLAACLSTGVNAGLAAVEAFCSANDQAVNRVTIQSMSTPQTQEPKVTPTERGL